MIKRVHHGQADEPPDDRGDGGQQLDDDLERFLHLGPQNSETKIAAPKPERHGDRHGQRRDAGRAGDQRQHAVAHVALRCRIPLGADEELAEH